MDEGRGIYSVAMFHVGASSISLAPTYFICQSKLMPLRVRSGFLGAAGPTGGVDAV